MVGGAHRPPEGDRRLDRRAAPMSSILYDRPYEDKSRVRVAGPFTVESLSPHRVVPAERGGADRHARRRRAASAAARSRSRRRTDFADMVLEHLRTAGVHQQEKGDRINFTASSRWPGEYIGAEGRFMEGENGAPRRASSSARNSAPSRASISSPPRARRPRRASTC